MFFFRKPPSPHCLKLPQFSKSCPKKIVSFALWRHLDGKVACILENGIVAEKRVPLSWEKVLWFQADRSSWPRGFKKCQTMFFHANTIKKGQKNAKLWRTCQTPFFHAKQLQKRPNFWNLALKVPTWQPCELLLSLELILWRFVSMLLFRSKGQR